MERIAGARDDEAMIAFYGELSVGTRGKPHKPARAGKNIRFETADRVTKAGLLESRKAEWEKWNHFNVVYHVSGAERQRMIDQGHKPLPLQWLEADKNEHKRRAGGPLAPACLRAAS